MALTTLYGLATCHTCRRARKWLDAQALDYTWHDVRRGGLSTELTSRWADSAGWDALINRRSRTWRELAPGDQARAGSDPTALLAEHPTLLKRPLLQTGHRIEVGFDEERWSQLLGLSQ